MHEQQRKFFASNSRFRIASPRRHGHYAQKQREAIDVLEAKNNLEIVAIDECKEMSLQDFEETVELLRDHMELQSFISTEKSNDWLREHIREQVHEQH